MSLKRVVKEINKNKRFLITSHVNLEGDALGSQLATRALLLHLGKTAFIVDETKVPQEYNFLPGIKYIKSLKDIKNFKYDILITLDCSDEERCKEIISRLCKGRPIINIDHHISNSNFGDINWVDPKSSSTSEMVYKLYKRMHIPLDGNIALWLYVGLLTDTGSFRYPNTNSLSHMIASYLMRYNLSISKIYKNIYENLSFFDMKLLTEVLMTMRQDLNGKIVWFEIKRKIMKAKRISFDLSEQALNFGRLIKDTEVIVLFKEELGSNDQIRLNLRSRGKVDVNKIAQFFQGGGHKNASGCTVKGKLKDAEKIVLKKIRDSMI